MMRSLTSVADSVWGRQWNWHTLAGCILAAAVGCGGPPVGMKGRIDYPQPAIAEMGRPDVVCLLRPFVAKVHPEDKPRFALHWATPSGPSDGGGIWNSAVDWQSTLESIDVAVTCPDSQSRHLQLSQFDNPLFAGQPIFVQSSTLFFTLGKNDRKACPWPNTRGFSADAKGSYRVSVSGTVHVAGDAEDIPFTTGEVQFEVADECLSNVAALAAASSVIGRYGQLVDDTIVDDRDGNRIVRYRTMRQVGPWSWQEARVLVRPDGSVRGVHYRTIDNCIAEGTVVETESGPLPVEFLRVGTRVWGFDIQRNRRVLAEVRDVRASTAARTLRFPTGLRVAPGHPIYAAGSWKPAREVRPDDSLLAFNLQTAVAGVCEHHETPCAVFDVTVDAPHNFFAGGVLVHNKDRAYWPLVDDPWYQLWPEP